MDDYDYVKNELEENQGPVLKKMKKFTVAVIALVVSFIEDSGV